MTCRTRFARDRNAATAVEFAMILPVLLIAVIGGFDMLHRMYARSVLEGAIEQAARDATLESNSLDPAATDAKVRAIFAPLVPDATFTFERRAYAGFGRVGVPERFTDSNGDGIRDPGECYIDQNGNRRWDADPGLDGNGSGNDIVRYVVTATYPALFPAWQLLGQPRELRVRVETRMRNQPFVAPVDRDAQQCD